MMTINDLKMRGAKPVGTFTLSNAGRVTHGVTSEIKGLMYLVVDGEVVMVNVAQGETWHGARSFANNLCIATASETEARLHQHIAAHLRRGGLVTLWAEDTTDRPRHIVLRAATAMRRQHAMEWALEGRK